MWESSSTHLQPVESCALTTPTEAGSSLLLRDMFSILWTLPQVNRITFASSTRRLVDTPSNHRGMTGEAASTTVDPWTRGRLARRVARGLLSVELDGRRVIVVPVETWS